MKSNLAYIGEAAHVAVAKEAQDPQVPASALALAEKQGIRMVASFPVADPVARQKVIDDSLAARRNRLDTYAKDTEAAGAKLSKLGITPLAFVPKSAWDRLCSEAGLYRLNPDPEGMVSLHISDHVRLLGRVAVVGTIFAATALVVAVIATIAGIVGFGPAIILVAALMVLYALSGAVIGGMILGLTPGQVFVGPFIWLLVLVTRVLGAGYNLLPRSVILGSFFPNGVESKGGNWRGDSTKTRLMLPPAPKEVSDVLARTYGLSLMVATMGEAIGFSESPGKIVGDKVLDVAKSSREEISRRWARAFADPIIYFEQGSAVAVIAQFGDFPIEQQLVDRVMNSEHLV